MNSAKKIPSPLVSLFPIAFLVGMLFATIHTFGSDALSGGSQISLLATTGMCVFIGMTFYRIPWKDYELAITNNISGVATAIIILLIIGALSGTWMISGVVPTLIYYGMQIIHPNFFLASTCIICALVSVMTGSSWTTIATIGIALLGIGKAQGFEEGWIAGAIISGAYFGDKISPLSDTTVLASSVTETPLFSHIRYMMITTVPSLLITLVIFTVMGLTHETNNTQQIAEFTAALDAKFNITPWLLAVPVITGILYNPQNEMFRRFRTKCSISQNETYLCESFFSPHQPNKKAPKKLTSSVLFYCLLVWLSRQKSLTLQQMKGVVVSRHNVIAKLL